MTGCGTVALYTALAEGSLGLLFRGFVGRRVRGSSWYQQRHATDVLLRDITPGCVVILPGLFPGVVVETYPKVLGMSGMGWLVRVEPQPDRGLTGHGADNVFEACEVLVVDGVMVGPAQLGDMVLYRPHSGVGGFTMDCLPSVLMCGEPFLLVWLLLCPVRSMVLLRSGLWWGLGTIRLVMLCSVLLMSMVNLGTL